MMLLRVANIGTGARSEVRFKRVVGGGQYSSVWGVEVSAVRFVGRGLGSEHI